MRVVVDALDPDWVDDNTMKCDVMFLSDEVDHPEVLDGLTIKPGLDEVRYVRGALVWKVNRGDVTKSGMMKLAGTPLYKQMTIRNCNTTRKLLALMEAAAPA